MILPPLPSHPSLPPLPPTFDFSSQVTDCRRAGGDGTAYVLP